MKSGLTPIFTSAMRCPHDGQNRPTTSASQLGQRVNSELTTETPQVTTANSGGYLRWKSVASWYAFATRSVSASLYRPPMNDRLTGVPSGLNPLGRATQGCPVRLVSWTILPNVVGATNTSTVLSASCTACITSVRT